MKFCYELNFRHSRFISYLFTIYRQGLLHFTPNGIHFNHDSRNRFVSNHDSQRAKRPDHGVTKIPFPPLSYFMMSVNNIWLNYSFVSYHVIADDGDFPQTIFFCN